MSSGQSIGTPLPRRRSGFRRFLVWTSLLICLALGLTYFICGLNQGDGTIMPATIFYFSVENINTYNQLQELQGRKVIIHYKEVIRNFFWQGDTDYFVYKAIPVK